MVRTGRSLLFAVGLGAFVCAASASQERNHSPSGGTRGTGGIVGRVIDQQSRVPVGGASISLLGTHRQTSTDSSGSFTEAGLGSGTYLIEVILEDGSPEILAHSVKVERSGEQRESS